MEADGLSGWQPTRATTSCNSAIALEHSDRLVEVLSRREANGRAQAKQRRCAARSAPGQAATSPAAAAAIGQALTAAAAGAAGSCPPSISSDRKRPTSACQHTFARAACISRHGSWTQADNIQADALCKLGCRHAIQSPRPPMTARDSVAIASFCYLAEASGRRALHGWKIVAAQPTDRCPSSCSCADVTPSSSPASALCCGRRVPPSPLSPPLARKARRLLDRRCMQRRRRRLVSLQHGLLLQKRGPSC